MASSLPNPIGSSHLPSSEKKARMAKAGADLLRKAENAEWIVNGRAIERARELSGLSLKQFADAVERDERQVRRWETAEERPQIETVLCVRRLKPSLVIALAEQADGVEVVTEIRVRKIS